MKMQRIISLNILCYGALYSNVATRGGNILVRDYVITGVQYL